MQVNQYKLASKSSCKLFWQKTLVKKLESLHDTFTNSEKYWFHLHKAIFHLFYFNNLYLQVSRSDVVMNSFIFLLICHKSKQSFYVNTER